MDRLLTFISVTTSPLEDDEPLTDKAMHTVESIQGQPHPDRWDLLIMQDIGDFSLKELRRMGAEQAQTEWVSFIPEGEVVKPTAVDAALAVVPDATSYAVGSEGLLWWRRTYWLEQVAS
jgi:hypothetical protein